MLHVYDALMGICLHSEPIDEKTNEIPVAQKLLQVMDLLRTVVTFDAMNTQRRTASIIAGRGGWYVGGLKGNHKGLVQEAERLFDEREMECAKADAKRHWVGGAEIAGGKVVTRQVYTMAISGGLFEGWEGVCALVRYDRQSEDKNRRDRTDETRYYITNMDASAQMLGQIILRHWEIETFHRYLDMTYGDDENATTDKNAYTNLGIIKKLVHSEQASKGHKGRPLCGRHEEEVPLRLPQHTDGPAALLRPAHHQAMAGREGTAPALRPPASGEQRRSSLPRGRGSGVPGHIPLHQKRGDPSPLRWTMTAPCPHFKAIRPESQVRQVCKP